MACWATAKFLRVFPTAPPKTERILVLVRLDFKSVMLTCRFFVRPHCHHGCHAQKIVYFPALQRISAVADVASLYGAIRFGMICLAIAVAGLWLSSRMYLHRYPDGCLHLRLSVPLVTCGSHKMPSTGRFKSVW